MTVNAKPILRMIFTYDVVRYKACGMKIMPSPIPAMKPPASAVSEIYSKLMPASFCIDKSSNMTKRNTHMKMRQTRIIPAPCRAFQLTMMLDIRADVSDIMPVMGPTETSFCTQIEKRLPRIPLPKNMIAIL